MSKEAKLKMETGRTRLQFVVASPEFGEISLGHLREIVKEAEVLDDDARVTVAGVEDDAIYRDEFQVRHILVRQMVDL